ncbi:acyl carrier protein [Agrobacterium sp. S2/73]|uniref:acyl carrier protein n=1 Tax=Rhizobium/Agrobacterium group TaxID=227290 RepID=UPI001ADD4799|nr:MULTISPECIES: acyl carrier protein [Rhizobium/Agrobacterium group]MBO9108718.1 acyl carrier protein [Agrobacterium sp. S2/73]QXZ73523.1 acyl carrier protein [Agrobacterium sp. S7/73]
MIDDKFRAAIKEAFPMFDGELTRDTTAADVPGWDSFGHVQLMFELEDRYGLNIDPQQALTCSNVGDLIDMVRKQIS